MRFSDFRVIESNIKKIVRESDDEDDVALPSNVMSSSQLYPREETKYITAIAKSIRNKKPFAFLPPRKSLKSKEAVFGTIDKIMLDNKELSVSDWETFASDIKNKDNVLKTEFEVNGEVFPINRMWKTEAATGAMGINKGDAAEAILGAAITAKFRAGGRSITRNDIIDILKEVINRGTYTGTTDYQTAGIEEDEFSFKLTLNAKSMKSLKMWIQEDDPLDSPKDFKIVQEGVSASTIRDLQRSVGDAAQYANSNKRAMTAVNKAKADPGKNKVEIISDGGDATQQSVTKVDLKITYDGQITRLLSLKAGAVKQFGQVSGAEWETVSDFFESVLKFRLPDSMKSQFGFKDKSEPDYKEYNYSEGPFAKLYAEMVKQIQVFTAGDDSKKEYNLVKNVYDGINFHATKGEEGVTMVILSPSVKIAYKELAFDERLLAALDLYDLQVINEPGLSNHRISIIGVLKNSAAKAALGKNAAKLDSKSVLVQLRSSVRTGSIRNSVEMGELLKELANVEKLDKQDAPRQTISADFVQDLKNKFGQLTQLTPQLKIELESIVDRLAPQDLKILIKANITWVSGAAAEELQNRGIS